MLVDVKTSSVPGSTELPYNQQQREHFVIDLIHIENAYSIESLYEELKKVKKQNEEMNKKIDKIMDHLFKPNILMRILSRIVKLYWEFVLFWLKIIFDLLMFFVELL